MAYVAWSVVAFEVPTAAKWNILGSNDASFNDGTGIAALGITKIVNPYKMRAFRNAALTSPNNATAKITLDVEDYDTNGNFATGTYTVPVTGYYKIIGSIYAGTAATICQIYKNGAVIAQGSYAVNNTISNVSTIEYLTAGNTIELYAYTASAVAVGVGHQNTFMGIELLSV